MKATHLLSRFLTAGVLLALPALACAGPDDAPRPRRTTDHISTRPAPPDVHLQESTTTSVSADEDDRPIQPLRQREVSVHYRIAYKLLNDLGFTGTEGDRLPIGYQQIYGPPPMLLYHRPSAPQPRRFPHFAASEEHGPRPPAPTLKPAADTEPAASEPSPAPPLPAAKPAPEEGPDVGVLPDASQSAGRSRDDEMLSYFRRPGPAAGPQNGSPNVGGGPQPQDAGDPGYLQAPQQLPIPPSRATYRVVPK